MPPIPIKKTGFNHPEKYTVNNKVKNAGGNANKYRSFETDGDVPARYSQDTRFKDLSADPATGKVDSKTRQEAMAGLEAELQGLLQSPIRREPQGDFEFVDGDGIFWDVKTSTGDFFDAARDGASVQKQLRNDPNVRVILDVTYVDNKQLQSLRNWIQNNVPAQSQNRIVEVRSNLL